MSFALFVSVMLVGFPLGKTFVLHSSQEEPPSAPASPIVRTSRCQGEPLQSIRKAMLKALNLDQEPQIMSTGMTHLRDQWKTAFKATGQSAQTPTDTTGNTTLPEDLGIKNNTDLQCCQLVSQIFIKDLGWDNWIVYPESFTYTQCTTCNPQLNLSASRCRQHPPAMSGTPSQMQCCKPTARELVPFLYLDELSTLVISSVWLTCECGCGPGVDPQPPQP